MGVFHSCFTTAFTTRYNIKWLFRIILRPTYTHPPRNFYKYICGVIPHDGMRSPFFSVAYYFRFGGDRRGRIPFFVFVVFHKYYCARACGCRLKYFRANANRVHY